MLVISSKTKVIKGFITASETTPFPNAPWLRLSYVKDDLRPGNQAAYLYDIRDGADFCLLQHLVEDSGVKICHPCFHLIDIALTASKVAHATASGT